MSTPQQKMTIKTKYKIRMIFYLYMFTLGMIFFFFLKIPLDFVSAYFLNYFLLVIVFFDFFLKKNGCEDEYTLKRLTFFLGASLSTTILAAALKSEELLFFWVLFSIFYYFEFLYFRYVEDVLKRRIYMGLRYILWGSLGLYVSIYCFFENYFPEILRSKVLYFLILGFSFTFSAKKIFQKKNSRLRLAKHFDLLQRPVFLKK